MNDLDSGLAKDLVNKGVTLLSVFSLMGSVVQLNCHVWHQRSGIHENKIYSLQADPIVESSGVIGIVGLGMHKGPQGELGENSVLLPDRSL